MKRCKACQSEKPESSFPPYRARGVQGRRGTCRECWNARWSPIVLVHQNRYYQENRNGLADRARARTIERHRKDPAATKRRIISYVQRHPDRTKARQAVTVAVRAGRLVPQPCERCGGSKVDAHHEDYSKPLEVRWLCRKHHGERHREINRGLEVPHG